MRVNSNPAQRRIRGAQALECLARRERWWRRFAGVNASCYTAQRCRCSGGVAAHAQARRWHKVRGAARGACSAVKAMAGMGREAVNAVRVCARGKAGVPYGGAGKGERQRKVGKGQGGAGRM